MTSTISTPDTSSHVAAWRVGAAVATIGSLASLLVWAVARLAGVDFSVTRADGEGMTIGPAVIVATLVVTVLVGTLVLAVAVRRTQTARGVLAWLGLALGLLSVPMPFSVGAEAGAQVALASMHVIVGLTWFLMVRLLSS